ncbi:alkaline phosphatase PhoX [Micromonospora okii]|uniref:alkaline phosphatase PhoX n=1 Tax=Micromonospora okii TaxID=1182970 RepID=UPI001E3F7394|nr:alkaline phosphatase PhoX [Micromonospora okii]
MSLDRRRFLAQSGIVGAGVALSGVIDALFTAVPALATGGGGYGPLVPDEAGLLDLPRGFRYRVLSRQGEPMSGGGVVPGNCDGMAAFSGPGPQVRLVRNHESWPWSAAVPVAAPPELTYDPAALGGTTTLVLRPGGVEQRVSLGGTWANCAGGPTPWRTWLSCEELEVRRGEQGNERDHGWIFEVDPYDPARNTHPTPLTAMGRFAHEAVCVDPRTGAVYETEDASGEKFGCFYRFLPNRPLGGHGSLRAGGRLQVMRVPGVADLSTVQEPGATFARVEWLDVPDPLATTVPIRLQDYGPAGVTHAQKLEGAWWGTDGAAYFVSSFAKRASGSQAEHRGQVWRYRPATRELTLVVVFHATGPGSELFESPDNICMTPSGGLMLCQDGDGDSYLMGTTVDGEPYLFARNRQNVGTETAPAYGEFAGACFSDDRHTMYVNCYAPGTTFAITGPFRR